MKSIAIITDSDSRVAKFIKENLSSVFGNLVKINNYYLNNLKQDDRIKDDVVLVMIKERGLRIKKFISSESKIIVAKRTMQEKNIYELFSMPKGTNVLVVNDNDETTLETISLFYELGINHLNLIPYNENKLYKDIEVAVTPAEGWRVPEYIDKIIDLGDRYLDIFTFMQIMSVLAINDKKIGMNLIKYCEQIVILDYGIRDTYKELFVKNEELDTIMNLSKEGIVFTNNNGEVTICNKSFREIFNIGNNELIKDLDNIFIEELKKALTEESITDEVFKYKNKYLNLNKQNIYNFGVKTGTYYNIQEITYIKQLEQNLTKKIREKGQVARYYFKDIKTKSKSMLECITLAKKISKSDLSVLIIGESGTGKELMAQSIHNESNRAKQPFIAVNCAAMPENLLESELFGYEAGAFTGALKEGKKGLFEQANNGTIFLDEIGDMPIFLQTKLLRVLQEKQVMRIGAQKIIDVNVRVIAATNKNLLKMIDEGKFREDLYYRLNVLPINIPPLREREDDVLELIAYFMEKDIPFTEGAIRTINSYNWPGNIRELQNVASYISLMCEDEVKQENLPFCSLDEKNKFDEEVSILKSKCDFLKVIEILKIIASFNEINESLGRTQLLKILNEKYIETSEGEIRKILSYLKELKFIESKVGRGGSKITEKGVEFIEDNEI